MKTTDVQKQVPLSQAAAVAEVIAWSWLSRSRCLGSDVKSMRE